MVELAEVGTGIFGSVKRDAARVASRGTIKYPQI
jgi:hypothetical protein